MQTLSTTTRDATFNKIIIPFHLLLIQLSFRLLLTTVSNSGSLRWPSAPPVGGVLCMSSFMPRCTSGVLYGVVFILRYFSLFWGLISLLNFVFGLLVFDFDCVVVVTSAGRVCQKDSIVGWSAGQSLWSFMLECNNHS